MKKRKHPSTDIPELKNPDRTLWDYINKKDWRALEKIVEAKKITPEMLLVNEDTVLNQGMNALWALASQCPHNLFNKGRNINPEILSILNSLIDDNLITQDMLLAHPMHPDHKEHGINVVWLLARKDQLYMIRKLWKKGCITPEAMLSFPRYKDHELKELNVLGLMAMNMHWDLIKTLLKANFITLEMFSSPSTRQPSVLWSLTDNGFGSSGFQEPLRLKFIEKDWVTTSILSACPYGYEKNYGNLLWLLTKRQWWSSLQRLVAKNLITTEMLLSYPKNRDDNMSGNVLWLLAACKQWNLIIALASKINTQMLLMQNLADHSNVISLLQDPSQPQIREIIKLLLKSPLNPLQAVPRSELAKISFIKDTKDEAAMVFQKLETSPLEPFVSDLPDIPPVTDFDPLSQLVHWTYRALSQLKLQIKKLGYLLVDMGLRIMPKEIIAYIYFLATGDSEQGVSYHCFPLSAVDKKQGSLPRILYDSKWTEFFESSLYSGMEEAQRYLISVQQNKPLPPALKFTQLFFQPTPTEQESVQLISLSCGYG